MTTVLLFVVALTAALATWAAVQAGAHRYEICPGTLPAFTLVTAAIVGTIAATRQSDSDRFLLAASIAGIAACAAGDLRTGYLFDGATLTIVALLTAIAVANQHASTALLSGATVCFPLLVLYALTRGRGIGFGDVKLALPMGIGLGTTAGLGALGFAFVSGALVGVLLLATNRTRNTAIPFGPFLALGTAISSFVPLSALLPS